jgi:hypothetical protein
LGSTTPVRGQDARSGSVVMMSSSLLNLGSGEPLPDMVDRPSGDLFHQAEILPRFVVEQG